MVEICALFQITVELRLVDKIIRLWKTLQDFMVSQKVILHIFISTSRICSFARVVLQRVNFPTPTSLLPLFADYWYSIPNQKPNQNTLLLLHSYWTISNKQWHYSPTFYQHSATNIKIQKKYFLFSSKSSETKYRSFCLPHLGNLLHHFWLM